MNDSGQRPLVGYPALDTFRHQLFNLIVFLEIAIRRTVRLRHGTQRPHAPVGLVGTPLVQLDLARRLLGTREQAADHHRIGAGHQRLGDITGIANTAIGNHRYPRIAQCFGNRGDSCYLRHTDTGDDPGGADRTGTDTDLDAVDARLDQCPAAIGRGDIAADNLAVRILLPDPAHHVEHTLRMTVGRIDNDHVDAGRH